MCKIVECVPNFSEGNDKRILEAIAACFSGREGVRLLDYSADSDHNRSVYTIIGEPDRVKEAMFDAAAKACELIDLRRHRGVHPRIGAVDVIPFIPLSDMTMADAAELAVCLGERIGIELKIPVYLYGEAAGEQKRRSLAEIRRGQFEGLADKMKDPDWQPDFGPAFPHPSCGAVAVGARFFLLAFNINLDSEDLAAAKAIASAIRTSSGGLPEVKAMGVPLYGQGVVQVSMNLTDYRAVSLRRVFDEVKQRAEAMGIKVKNSEIIGLPPIEAFADCTPEYLQLVDFSRERILDNYIDNDY